MLIKRSSNVERQVSMRQNFPHQTELTKTKQSHYRIWKQEMMADATEFEAFIKEHHYRAF